MMERFETIKILLVEDNPGDARLVQEAFKEHKVSNNLFIVKDGIEAMNFLRKHGTFSDAPTPDIVLLDLNLPKKDGREVLAELKADKELSSIPIVVLTTSDNKNDIASCYGFHANCYVTKPIDFDQFSQLMDIIAKFWFRTVRLPS